MAISNPAEQARWLLDQIDEAIGGVVTNLESDSGAVDINTGMADGYARVLWNFGLAEQRDVASYLSALRGGRTDEATELREKLLAAH